MIQEVAINPNSPQFTGLIDLASERLGGQVILASDEFFAAKENLIKPDEAVFIEGKFTDHGKWMDGWETRRKRAPGNDWCIIKLGMPGLIRGIDIDTSHFLGNHPAYASIDGLEADPATPPQDLSRIKDWKALLPQSPLKPGSHNFFTVADSHPKTYLKLNIYPDGGIARLRVFGRITPGPENLMKSKDIDLIAIENGGMALACSDMFFSPMQNLLMPGRAENMVDGWETRRRRGPGFDWVIVELGLPGKIARFEVDTNHFKGNYPDQCSVEACQAPGVNVVQLTQNSEIWTEVLSAKKLSANKRHFFDIEQRHPFKATHVRLNIFPDGGVSRFRAFGSIIEEV